MCMIGKRRGRRGFTLVELLVVIGIIGTLIAILLPATAAIRRSAKTLKTKATFTAIAAGLEAYRNATGEPYPPSHSDAEGATNSALTDTAIVNNPYWPHPQTQPMWATGANLLLWALGGADLLGTPGFKDLRSRSPGFRGWWDDTNQTLGCADGIAGLYALDIDYGCGNGTMEPLNRRFGAFIDLDTTDITTMEEYAEDTLLPKNSITDSVPMPLAGNWGTLQDYLQQRFILDGFGFPVLYYKANVGASRMVTDWTDVNNPIPGVYSAVDNALYTGLLLAGSSPMPNAGMDLGAGKDHQLREANSPDSNPAAAGGRGNVLGNQLFDRSLARFILNQKVAARNVPVKKDSYLLISPGSDALWGTDDDITNFNQ